MSHRRRCEDPFQQVLPDGLHGELHLRRRLQLQESSYQTSFYQLVCLHFFIFVLAGYQKLQAQVAVASAYSLDTCVCVCVYVSQFVVFSFPYCRSSSVLNFFMLSFIELKIQVNHTRVIFLNSRILKPANIIFKISQGSISLVSIEIYHHKDSLNVFEVINLTIRR